MNKSLVVCLLAVLLMVFVAPVPLAAQPNNTRIRPIEDFVSQQGTYCFDDGAGGCFLFIPPIANFLGASDPSNGRLASIDYAGLVDRYIEKNGGELLGTQFSGTVTERPLKDGRAEVQVVLRTKNALTWVVEEDYNSGPLLFGARVGDVLEGAAPTLCDVMLQVKFFNTAPGDPLPDLIQLFAAPDEGQEPLFFALRCNAEGPLRAAFGVPDGTPGRAVIVQTGLFMTGFHGAVSDGFPVERIDLHRIGAGQNKAVDGTVVDEMPRAEVASTVFLPLVSQAQ